MCRLLCSQMGQSVHTTLQSEGPECVYHSAVRGCRAHILLDLQTAHTTLSGDCREHILLFRQRLQSAHTALLGECVECAECSYHSAGTVCGVCRVDILIDLQSIHITLSGECRECIPLSGQRVQSVHTALQSEDAEHMGCSAVRGCRVHILLDL